ncbi:MAG: Fe-S cluster assembly protein SufD [Candidatus Sumerlaeaceae bacterium]|nr:Fe-S cluster assembly protein SufD [Candidatus Sumerlaeaceae bacterium]
MTTLEVSKDIELYQGEFSKLGATALDSGNADLGKVRQAAIARFGEIGFPTTRDEEWRFTNVSPIARTSFKLAGGDFNQVSSEMLKTAEIPGMKGPQAVFCNGHFVSELSSLGNLPKGVIVGSLAAAASHPAVRHHLAKHANFENHAFVALNTAFMQDGAFVYVPKGVVVEEPIHLLFVSTSPGETGMSHPRNLIVAESNSQVQILESYSGTEEDVYLTNVVTEVVAGDGAVVDHYKLQREGHKSYHIATIQVYQERSSNFSTQSISFGAAISRNDVNTILDGEGCVGTLNGIYMIGGSQLADNHTRIDHAKPNCESHELYKGILEDKSRGVFNGRIIVRQDAQKTNSKQTNKSLLLSDQALVNTNPQLEIFADDVKCTHGATIGQIDEEHIFYLRSRGISAAVARHLLVYAFANDIIRRIKIEPLRAELEMRVLKAQEIPTDFVFTEGA